MTPKELTISILREIENTNIKARVRLFDSCGSKVIQVYTNSFDAKFSETEQITIKSIAISRGLTFVRGLKIDLNQNTNPQEFNFYI